MRDSENFERKPGRGERGPRVFAPGDLKLLLLSLLGEQPGHGYDLIRQIEKRFDGSYTPSPGVIYPTLNFLEEAELIQGQPQGSKRLYTITDTGRSALTEQAVALDGLRVRIEVSKHALRGHDRPAEIHEAVGNLRHALHMHQGRWTPEEIERVRDLLNVTAKAIAGGPHAPDQESADE
ncbi:PadR family transcriptional regulator [Pseudomonas fulva]|uniref:PadR family transcriptional regulator n=1 Tax=Pseudomonas fulva TaxID=47880 RepID=UPI003D2F1ACD